MHPYFLGAFAAEHRAQMLASAQSARLARQAGGQHRRAHIRSAPGRWARRLAMVRIRPLPAAQIRVRQNRLAR